VATVVIPHWSYPALYICEQLGCDKGQEQMSFYPAREMSNQRLESETNFFTHECQCQAESFSGAGFRWYAAKLCERFASYARRDDLQNITNNLLIAVFSKKVIIVRPEK
jgi:hypothetical protein